MTGKFDIRHVFLSLSVVFGVTFTAMSYHFIPSPFIPERTIEVLSPVYVVDQIYKSMQGPQSSQQVYPLNPNPYNPELLWITGIEAVMVGEDGTTPMPQELMCHSNLDFDYSYHHYYFGKKSSSSNRLFTLSQGQTKIEFPKGFGLPVMSSEPLNLTTQVLNLNFTRGSFKVRHKIKIKYVRARDYLFSLKPLFPGSAYGLVSLDDQGNYFGIREADPQMHGPGCLIGEQAASGEYVDQHGQKFAGHWVVKPGKEVNRTLVTKLMGLPYDTTLHYIAVHLHPFAESLELRDLTADKTVFKSNAKNFSDKIGLEQVGHFSSAEGFPMYKDHDYEIISTYQNTSGSDQDSMAVMYLYFQDKHFHPKFNFSRSLTMSTKL